MKNYLRTSFLKIKRFGFYNYLFFLSLLIYLFTHLIKLEDFPIYFFCDEAIQAVKADKFIKNGFKDEFGHFFPPFFKNFYNYSIGLSVYLNIPGVVLFGKKIWVVRGTTVLVTLIGSFILALTTKKIFNLKNYWVIILFFSSSPIFFLHSRTGFEISIATAMYAVFISFYLLYREGNPNFLFWAIAFAALSFYSSGVMWPIVLFCAPLLTVLDFHYHFKNWKRVFFGVLFLLIVFLPFLDFYRRNPDLINYHGKRYNTYWSREGMVLGEKANKFLENYKLSFSPQWLFLYNSTHSPRHTLKGYGYFPSYSIPFIFLGLVYLFLKIRESNSRIVLLAFLASPLGGVVTEPSPTRNLVMAVPLAIIFGLGIKLLENFLGKVFNYKENLTRAFSIIVFLFLFYKNISMCVDAFINGPTWFHDYGLYGMQYGSKQLYTKINQALDKYNFAFGPTEYTNGAEIFPIFFLSEDKQKRFKFGDEFCSQEFIGKENIFFLTKGKFEVLKKCNLPMKIEIKDIIFAPDGQELFYEVELHKL